MPTLYVENVPDDLYKALRKQAKRNRSSIASEVIALLKQWVPTEAEVKRRRQAIDDLIKLSSSPAPAQGVFPAAEQMIREDRER